LKSAKTKTCELKPLELCNGVAHRHTHLLYEPVTPLTHSYLKPGIGLSLSYKLHISGSCPAALDIHALTELLNCLLCRYVSDLYEVFFCYAVAGMNKPVGKVSVISKQEYALCVVIKTANRKDALIGADKVRYKRPPLRVVERAYNALWFIK